MSAYCRKCGRSNFRLSRIHSFDFGRALLLQYPVRCRICHHRDFVSFVSALKLWLHPHRPRKMGAIPKSAGPQA